MRILLIEDDVALAGVIREALTSVCHEVDVAHDGAAGEEQLHLYPYHLLVLDLLLPKRSGLEICRAARAGGLELPILMLTALDSLADKVQGFDAGADDYLAKPFEIDELKVRVRALLRRHSPRQETVLRVGDLALDPAAGVVQRSGQAIKLMPKEFELLELLMRNVGRIVTHSQILLGLWASDAEQSPGALRTHVKGLRKAIGDTGLPRLIESVHGRGYRMGEQVADS